MKRTMILATLVVVLLVAVFALGGCADEGSPEPSPNGRMSSTQLVEHPKAWDGKTLSFEGEAIGEVMVRGDYAWIHLNDDAYYLKNVEEGAHLGGYNTGMAIWVPADLARKISVYGDYKHEGDVVKITGVFHATCVQHGGDMDIHATGLTVVHPGHNAADPVKLGKLTLAILLAVFAVILYVTQRTWDRWGREGRGA